MTPSPLPPPLRTATFSGTADGAYDDVKDRTTVHWHPWHGPAGDTRRHVPGLQAQPRPQLASSHAHRIATDLPPQVRLAVLQQRLDAIEARQAQLRRGRITCGQTLALSVKVALQSAARELGIQVASQGTQLAVRALLVRHAHQDGTGRWVAPAAARGQVLMASRGWILQQPGQAAALAQERRWQQLEAGIEAASVQLAAAWQSGDEPQTVRIRLPAAPAQPAFDVVFGREDGQLAFVPVR